MATALAVIFKEYEWVAAAFLTRSGHPQTATRKPCKIKPIDDNRNVLSDS
jgi:hypothetical protein